MALIRWHKDFTENGIRMGLIHFNDSHPNKKVMANPLFSIPQRLWQFLAENSDMDPESKWNEISLKKVNKLTENLFKFPVKISGKTTFKEEFVTAGGVDLSEINPDTMESKKVPGLYFAGEVIDVDGITGGYNFQAAWSTGYLAGINVAKF
ncbi:MAG: NAD(P)/FAD-dependent oxidoreductase [Cyclobacteriaceae bacterium]